LARHMEADSTIILQITEPILEAILLKEDMHTQPRIAPLPEPRPRHLDTILDMIPRHLDTLASTH
jgi:hypothetical protein